MESAYDTCNTLILTDFASVIRDAADTAVGTAGDNKKPLIRPAHQCGIVQAEVLPFCAVYYGRANGLSLFKAVKLRNLTQENTVFREKNRRLSGLITEQPVDLFQGKGGTYVPMSIS